MIKHFLKQLKLRGLKQREISEKIGIGRSYISVLMNGGTCSIETLVKFADSFGVSTDEVLGRSGNMRTVTDVESLLLDVIAGDEELALEVLKRAEVEKYIRSREEKRGEKAA